MTEAEKAIVHLFLRAMYGAELTAEEKRMLLKLGCTDAIGMRKRLYESTGVPDNIDFTKTKP